MRSPSPVYAWLLIGLLIITNACASTSQPLGKAERARLQQEEKILVYGEKKRLNGLSAISIWIGNKGPKIRMHGGLGLVRAPLIRDATINRIRKLSGLTNFVLLDTPLSRDMSQVDPLSQDAVFRSAYHGIYLVFRSGWELRNNQDQYYGATGRDLLYGPSGLYFSAEGLMIRPNETRDDVLWRADRHIVATEEPFVRRWKEDGVDWFRRLNTSAHATVQEMGDRLAEFCADHLARSFAGQPPGSIPVGMQLLPRPLPVQIE